MDGKKTRARARGRVLSIRAARYPLGTHLNAALRHRCYPESPPSSPSTLPRNRRPSPLPSPRFPRLAGRDATSTVVAARDPGISSTPRGKSSTSSSQAQTGTHNTYYTRSRERVRARSLVRAALPRALSRRPGFEFARSRSVLPHDGDTPTRRATRSTNTGQNGARHCPATPTPERARPGLARTFAGPGGGRWGEGGARGLLPTSRCGA